MILRGIVFCLFVGISWNILSGQSPGIYEKPNLTLGPVWKIESLQQSLVGLYPILKKTGSELILTDDISSPGGRHITFAQAYQGKEIHRAGLKVNLDHNGKVYSVLSTLKDFAPSPNMKFTRSEEEILTYAEKLTQAYELQIAENWWIRNGLLLPVYRVITFSHAEVVSYEFLIHGQNGEILQQEDRGAYFHRHTHSHHAHTHMQSSDTSGWARLFRPDPCTEANVSYGDLFTDAADMHLPIFDDLLDTVELKGLTYENGVFRLVGPHVQIEDRAPFNIPPATSTNGEFYYTRDQSGFEDVMVYYHLDTFQRYVQSLGFTNLENRPFKADPHGKSDLDQSVFVVNGGDSYILFGDGGVDDAEDADVIIHEYGHALSNAAAPDTRSGTERKGLDEGIGDYFASAYSQDLNPWGWHEVFIWDGHNEFWPGRMSVNNLTYPPPSGSSFYVYGELWAATLMQIRNQLGAEITDKLQLQEMYSNFVGMTLPDAARLLLDADSMLFQGANFEVISEYFCQRKLLEQNSCLPVSIEEEMLESIVLFPNPSDGNFSLELPRSIQGGTLQLQVQNIRGKTVWRQVIFASPRQQVRISVSPGVYLLTLLQEGATLGTKKLIISEE